MANIMLNCRPNGRRWLGLSLKRLLDDAVRGLSRPNWWRMMMMMMMTTAISLKIQVFWDGTLYQPADSFWSSNDGNVFMFRQSVLDCLPIDTVSSTVTYVTRCSLHIGPQKQISGSSRTNGTTITFLNKKIVQVPTAVSITNDRPAIAVQTHAKHLLSEQSVG